MTRRIWRMQDGLSDNVISAVAETPEHYLWIGTPQSLIRFDGFHFTDVSAEIAPAIRDFGIRCLFTAKDGSLWIGTGGGTLLQVQGSAVLNYGAKDGLRAFNVNVLQQDIAGVIWAGTDHGIYRFAGGHFQRVSHIGDPSVYAMISDGDGGLWIGGHRLIHYANGVFEDIPLPKQNVPTRIEGLARTPDGTLWIGTLGGLLQMSAQGLVSPKASVSHEVSALYVDQRHRLWVGTFDSGLFLQLANNTFAHIVEATEGLSNTVLALLNYEDGDLWLGTHSGLVRLSDTGMHLTTIPAIRNAQHASVAPDSDGSLWICAGKAFHLANGRLLTPKLPLVGSFPVRVIMRAADGALWIGTAGGGAIRIPKRGRPERYAAKVGTSYITGFLQGRDGDVWIATEGGIAVWRKGDVVSFQHVPGAPHQAVLSIAIAKPDGVWIGTSLGLLRLSNGRFVSDPAGSALGNHAVRALHSSSDETLWLGTESGLFRWKDHQMLQVPLEGDVKSEAVLSILEDAHGRLWLGGPDQVRRVQLVAIDRIFADRADGTSTGRNGATDSNDSVIPEVFAVLKETDAELYGGMPSSAALDGANGAWYISDAGPVHISGDARQPSQNAPPIAWQQIAVDGRDATISENTTLSLPASTQTLEIAATPVMLGSHAGLRMRRRLIGFDTSWKTLAASHAVTYTNLPPGKYRYRVEVSWGDWRKASFAELPIVQKAHFYHQGWFLVLCAVLTSITIWLLHRQRLQRLATQLTAVAEERNRIAREMHDTILQGCIGISFLLDGIESNHHMQRAEGSPRSLLPVQSLEALQLARAQIERTIDEARVAIWNLRRTEAEAQLDRSLRELFDKMTGRLTISAAFQSSGPSLQLTREQKQETLMAAQEALQNAIKHAGNTKISVYLRYMTNLVRIEITDEGCGMSQASNTSNATGHFGVLGMRERMIRIGGTCRISSAEGRGTTVTLEIPSGTPQQVATEAK
jgi:signal transduction histidine kinase/ligand-binding sensor domain-containing protein